MTALKLTSADFLRRYPSRDGGSLRQYYIFGKLAGRTQSVRGGRFALLMLEIYDEDFEVFWRYSPAPTRFQRDFAEELAMEVVPPGPWEDLPFQKEAQLIARVVPTSLAVADDVGTNYVKDGHQEAIGGVPVEGRVTIAPAIPREASKLEFGVLGATFGLTIRTTQTR